MGYPRKGRILGRFRISSIEISENGFFFAEVKMIPVENRQTDMERRGFFIKGREGVFHFPLDPNVRISLNIKGLI